MIEKSNETIFNFKEFKKHLVQQYALNTTRIFFFEKDNNKTWTECCEKWSEYHTCRVCEDEVNRKGNLTKPQEAVHSRYSLSDISLCICVDIRHNTGEDYSVCCTKPSKDLAKLSRDSFSQKNSSQGSVIISESVSLIIW